MSIYTAMRSGVSALAANSSALAVISDNIANVNTTAYKRAVTDFSAMINGQNTQTSYNAGGVIATSRRFVTSQGALEQTRSATDMAISGNGFFVVSMNSQPLTEGGTALFSRSGSFTVDADGYLVNADGQYLQGWEVAEDGTVTTSPTSLATLKPINVADVGGEAEPTRNVTMSANLNSNEDIYAGAPAYAIGALSVEPPTVGAIVPHYSTTLEVFDSLGAARTIGVGFLKTAPNTWRVEVYARPAADAPTNPGGRLAEGTITFNTSGAIDTVTGTIASPIVMAWDASTGADQTVPLTFDFANGISQFSAAYGVNSVTADGVPSGDLLNLVLEDRGMLTAQFTNGRSRALYQVPVATFLNPNGLQAEQGGLYRTTLASGLYTINAPGSGRAGEIRASVLEGSSVDLGTEFTQLITTQRAYSASSKIITTADEMLEELIRIKR